MRNLVTGATGFVGRHVVPELLSAGMDVVAGSPSTRRTDNMAQAHPLDVCDRGAVRAAIEDGIDVIFHLAFSRVRPTRMALVALEGTAIVMEEAARVRRPPRLLLVSSGAVYGAAGARRPLTEQDAAAPVTYYAVLKLAQEHLAASYARRGALHVVTVRPFNLVGPGEDGTLVTGSLALQIARGERPGAGFEIRAGHLDAYRDFIDVRDAARAFVLAAQVGEAGEVFNVCSGRAVQVWEAVGVLSRAA